MLGVTENAIETANALIWAFEVYLWIGAGVAVLFLLWGIDRINPDARGSYLFRVLAIAGVVGLWPLVIARWIWLEREAR